MPATAIPKKLSVPQLKKLLVKHDDGVLKSGKHSEGRDFCAMEFIAKVAGEPWTDNPKCVHSVLSAYCRRLNDAKWSDDETRTDTMLPLLAAVFGTADLKISVKNIAEQTIRLIVPEALKTAASIQKSPEHKEKLLLAAEKCKNDGTKESAIEAKKAADAVAANQKQNG